MFPTVIVCISYNSYLINIESTTSYVKSISQYSESKPSPVNRYTKTLLEKQDPMHKWRNNILKQCKHFRTRLIYFK